MCGVPVHTADAYLQKLIRLGHRVAVCEQLEDPAEARKRGYSRMVLDTVPQLQAAITLYQSVGFHEIGAYTFNPVPGVRFYACDL